MEIDLHCNIPDGNNIPNPAIGYLKAYLSMNNIKTRGIYWNLLPPELMDKYISISQDIGSRYENESVNFWLAAAIAKFLFSPDAEKASASVRLAFQGMALPFDEIKGLAVDMKDYIATSIEQKGMAEVDAAGFTMKLSQWLINYYILKEIKSRNPNVVTIMGGMNTRAEALEFMRRFKEADYAIWGEGEVSLTGLVKQLDDPISISDIPNLVYREGAELKATEQLTPEDLPDIGRYPYADHEDYFNRLGEFGYLNILPIIPIWGIRSCSWSQCKFCVLNDGYCYRERAPEDVVGEIEYQTKKYENNFLIFLDTDIGRRKREDFNRFLELMCDSVERRGRPYSITGGEITPLRLDRESIARLKFIGFEALQIGFEAVSDALLIDINKKHRLIHNIQALKLADEQGLRLTGLNVIAGTPSESAADIVESTANLHFLRFLLSKFPITRTKLALNKGSPYYMEIPGPRIDEFWNNDPYHIWPVIKDMEHMIGADKRDFSGFHPDELVNEDAWLSFGKKLTEHAGQHCFYEWVEYGDGSSHLQEWLSQTDAVPIAKRKNFIRGHHLDPVETQLLVYCDTIKSFSEVAEAFQQFEEQDLRCLAACLKHRGLMYFDANMRMLLSIPSSLRMKPYEFKYDICLRDCSTYGLSYIYKASSAALSRQADD